MSRKTSTKAPEFSVIERAGIAEARLRLLDPLRADVLHVPAGEDPSPVQLLAWHSAAKTALLVLTSVLSEAQAHRDDEELLVFRSVPAPSWQADTGTYRQLLVQRLAGPPPGRTLLGFDEETT